MINLKHIHKAVTAGILLSALLYALWSAASPLPSVEEVQREYEKVERLYWLW